MPDNDNNGKIIAGIDVGKADLALSVAAGAVQRYSNTPEGIAALALELARQSVDLAVHEPTGGDERPPGEAQGYRIWIFAPAALLICRIPDAKTQLHSPLNYEFGRGGPLEPDPGKANCSICDSPDQRRRMG